MLCCAMAVPMAKLRMLGNRLATLDTRRVKPEPKTVDPELHDPAHVAWRRAVLSRAHWQCQAISTKTGLRCPARHPDQRLFADRVQERADRPDLRLDVGNGAALCGRHHTLKSAAARAERFGLSARDLGFTLAPQQEPQAEPRPNLDAPGRLTIA